MCNGDSSSCFINPVAFARPNEPFNDEVVGQLSTAQKVPFLAFVNTAEVTGPQNNSIYAVVAFPETQSGDSRLYSCTIDCGTVDTTISATRNAPKIVTGYNNGIFAHSTEVSGFKRSVIDSAWAELLNPPLSSDNVTVLSHMSSAAGMWNSSRPSASYNYPFIVESMLAMLVNNGVGRATYNSSMIGTLKGSIPDDPWDGGEWTRRMLPRHGLGWGPQDAFDIDADTASKSTSLTMYATVYGYAWSWRPGKLQLAAIITLLVYSLFATGHLVYSVTTGWSSTAWDSTPEIVALAINSRTPESMHDTGAGIDTINPMRQKVTIRYIDSKLEYVFRGALDRGAPVKPNREYP